MPDYQWKLIIVERNLSLVNWLKLMPEAQERMLEEADELMGDLPLQDRRRLLSLLARLQNYIQADLQQKIQEIFSNQSTPAIRKGLEFSIQNHHLSVTALWAK